VPQLITIAPNNGDQPSFIKCFTAGFRRVNVAHVKADSTTRILRIRGTGVSMTRIKRDETRPTKERVTRSPKQLATGGAMLSDTST